MKLPKLKKNNLLSLNFGKNYILKLPEDSALIKSLPKLVDIAMDRKYNFPNQNKLQIELQHLTDLLLNLETKKKPSKP